MKTILIVGSTGIVGRAAAARFAELGWRVLGLSRSGTAQPDVTSLRGDLQDARGVADALAGVQPDVVLLAAWTRGASEAENIRLNGGAVRNVLAAVHPGHVALVTGLKHYLGPFEAYGRGALPQTPFREEQGRLDVANFYYAQEDEVFAAAKRDGSTFSVHRPHTIIGDAVGNAMNMGSTLAVYATLCKAKGTPFRFPGSQAQWSGLTDMTDARLLARHVHWAATTPAAANEAFNVVDGDVFRWSWMWPRLAAWFGVEAEPFDGVVRPLELQMADDAPRWAELAKQHALVEADLTRVASPWHTDADLGRPIEVVTDMSKSRRLGFRDYQPTDDAFYDLFTRLRAQHVIP